jgi:hypothetical protein
MPKKKAELKLAINEVALIIHADRENPDISPSSVADAAATVMDPDNAAPPLLRKVAIYQLRQIARRLLRKHFNPSKGKKGEITEPDSLFPDLQWRYPRMKLKGEEPRYALLKELTRSDVAYNVANLRRVGSGMQAHADRLEAWGKKYARDDEAA